jgi:heme/copper-type cytochrome/quinol oxidase subunit 3
MAEAPIAVVRRLPTVPRRDSGRRPQDSEPQAPPISNARLAVVIALVGEVMFFTGLIGAYLVFRVGSSEWPPPNLPRLPLAVTWLNTMVLLASGVTMVRARRSVNRNDAVALQRNLALTAGLGILFVLVQGSEWIRLIHHGLTLSTGMYGATFYTLIGTHALHVAGAIFWLGLVWVWARRGQVDAQHDAALDACTIYWIFVCALWVMLFALVYG